MTSAPPHPWPSLQHAARQAGISYTELAERIGTSRQSVSAYARGCRRPSEDTIADLARVLGVPYDELRADVPFATSPLELVDEIDGLVDVLSTRLTSAINAFEEIKAKRAYLQRLVQVPA